jgi:type IV pilus assembly protein PilA
VLQRLRQRTRHEERGFTLIETLVVILLLGILAALALVVFLGQKDKASDAEAKSNARNLVSQVELCYAAEEDFRMCDSEAELSDETGLAWGSNAGEVRVVTAEQRSYTVTATSTTGSTFSIIHTAAGERQRVCEPNGGGCRSSGW